MATLVNKHEKVLVIRRNSGIGREAPSIFLQPEGWDGDAMELPDEKLDFYSGDIERWTKRGLLAVNDSEPTDDIDIPLSVTKLPKAQQEAARALAMGTSKQFQTVLGAVATNKFGEVDAQYMIGDFVEILEASIDWIDARGRNKNRVKDIQKRIDRIKAGKLEE